MFFRLLTAAILCLAVRGADEEIMHTDASYLFYLKEHAMPTEFTSACPPKASDIVFALDGSASINAQYFDAGKNLIKNIAKQLSDLGLLGSGPKDSRVGAFQFGSSGYESFPFETSLSEINAALDGTFYQNASSSRIADAVDWALNQAAFFAGAERPSIQKVLVLLTDCLDNCDNTKEISAQAKAKQAGVELWLVSYTPDVLHSCVEALTGGESDRHRISASIDDVSIFTKCVEIVSNITCENNGTAWCECAPGYTGKYCEKAIDCCTRKVLQNGKNIDVPLCSEHGHCLHDDKLGCSCNCTDPGWFGPLCDQYPIDQISKRCIAYPYPDEDKVTAAEKKKVKPEGYRCDTNHQRCIADNINCHLNMPVSKDSNGKAYCPDSFKVPCNGLCECRDPIGWCIPMERYDNLIAEATKAAVFAHKFNVAATPSS